MTAIERDNPSLMGMLGKDFGRASLDRQRLGQVIKLVSDIALGSAADRAKDTLGRVYEYFLARFASAEGKSGGQFYTSARVVRVLVAMLAPYKGRVYDPVLRLRRHVRLEREVHRGAQRPARRHLDLRAGVELHDGRLAKMNLALCSIDA